MNESLISKITCEAARKVIYHQHMQIESLKLRLDRLEQQMQPTPAIGFRVKEGEKSMTTAFKNARHHVPD